MAGMYPDDTFNSSTGTKEVGLVGGEFSNGTVAPYVAPSRLPAETLNLLLNNIQTAVEDSGASPNNTDGTQLSMSIRNSMWSATANYLVGQRVVRYLGGTTGFLQEYLCLADNANQDPLNDNGTYWRNADIVSGTPVWSLYDPTVAGFSLNKGLWYPNGASIPSTAPYYRLVNTPIGTLAPDWRGYGLRGYDNTSTVNSATLLSKQMDALQNITGALDGGLNVDATYNMFTSPSGVFTLSGSITHVRVQTSGIATLPSTLSFNASNVARTSTETRTKNVILALCIKI